MLQDTDIRHEKRLTDIDHRIPSERNLRI